MPRAKLTAGIYLFVVFLSGAMVGAFTHRLYMVKTVLSSPSPRRLGPAEWRKHIVDEMRTKVKLDDQQINSLQQIFDDTDAQFKDLHAKRKPEDQKRSAENQGVQNQMVDRINQILRDDQKPLYEQYRSEREAERKRRQAAEGDRKGGPGK
jgi:hypothetical protein